MNLFAQEDSVREPIDIQMGAESAVKKGSIFFDPKKIEEVSSQNGYLFECYCYMNGQREFTAQLEGEYTLPTADKACKKFEGGLYQDLGIASRTGTIRYTLTRSCASSASRHKSQGR